MRWREAVLRLKKDEKIREYLRELEEIGETSEGVYLTLKRDTSLIE